ncbi:MULTISPECIES: dUTP diphosphatase [Bacillaceae]|uniref:dUTP diphosphatase n=1 Tax=Bacillaceae TaxID=186817 RepID=UPI000C75A8C8|nr:MULTISPECIES: dUTP diphosphatase [Bacillaceae]PLR68363.1 dUTPase [Bacillus sp. UMB0893]QNG60991.1 dUTP diphosphatase [Bacillus sp. PAMC26568]
MNLEKLFEMQKNLDSKIEKQHNLEHEPLLEKKILALLVEVGELANETRCFKFWSLKPPAEASVILEEYVDGVHFILSLGIEIGITANIKYESNDSEQTLTEHFMQVYEKIAQFEKSHSEDHYLKLFRQYLMLGQALGFSGEQVEAAYVLKNEVNHDRQKQGY